MGQTRTALQEVYADFNARTPDDLVSLETHGSKLSLATSSPVQVGQWVMLCDGEIAVEARIERHHGKLFARPSWETQRRVGETDGE